MGVNRRNIIKTIEEAGLQEFYQVIGQEGLVQIEFSALAQKQFQTLT